MKTGAAVRLVVEERPNPMIELAERFEALAAAAKDQRKTTPRLTFTDGQCHGEWTAYNNAAIRLRDLAASLDGRGL